MGVGVTAGSEVVFFGGVGFGVGFDCGGGGGFGGGGVGLLEGGAKSGGLHISSNRVGEFQATTLPSGGADQTISAPSLLLAVVNFNTCWGVA